MTISNKHKNIFHDFINNSNLEFLNWLRLINKASHKMPKSKNTLTRLLKGI